MIFGIGKNEGLDMVVETIGIPIGIVTDVNLSAFFLKDGGNTIYVEMREYDLRLLSMLRSSQESTPWQISVCGHLEGITDHNGNLGKIIAHKIIFANYRFESQKTIAAYIAQQQSGEEEVLNPSRR